MEAYPESSRSGERRGKLSGRQVFLHDLALHLGCTVRELKKRMHATEFANWQKYAKQRTMPFDRLQAQVALIAYVVINALSSDNSSPIELSSLILGGEGEKVEEINDSQQAASSAFAGASSKGVHRLGQKRKPKKKAKE